MFRSNGVKLISWLARRSLNAQSSPLHDSLIRGGYRNFGSVIRSHNRILTNPNYKYVNQPDWLRPGSINFSCGPSRSVHYTGREDYYDTLGVSFTATESEIMKSYHALAKKWHPDANKDDPEEAEKNFRKIQEAYEVLKEREKRLLYNTTLFKHVTFCLYIKNGLEFEDHYETLGVDIVATESEIKKSYYELAKKWHPDANKDDPEEAENNLRKIQEAYEVLIDGEKRSQYVEVFTKHMTDILVHLHENEGLMGSK